MSLEKTLLDITELCQRYGFKPWTIRSYCSQRKIPFIKIGRRVFFRVADMEQWLDEHKQPALEEHI
jgi:predicted DNA-binding transcriptional regulator AlpA